MGKSLNILKWKKGIYGVHMIYKLFVSVRGPTTSCLCFNITDGTYATHTHAAHLVLFGPIALKFLKLPDRSVSLQTP